MNGFVKSVFAFLSGVSVLGGVTVGCRKGVVENHSEEGEIITKTVKLSMTPRNGASSACEENYGTKTVLFNYDTAGVSKVGVAGKWHPVGWKEGDVVSCYCQTGVYMSYRLTDEDLLNTGAFVGEEAKAQIIYRVGDTWVVCYSKGRGIGDYIGSRKKGDLILSNGVPREQTGVFGDYHICLACNHPDAPFVFQDMQAFIRFEVTQAAGSINRDGLLLGKPVTKIELHSLNASEKMAGNLELIDDGGWRTTLLNRGEDADSMITVTPPGGSFVPEQNYFVAVPARRYSLGIRFDLFTKADGESVATRKAYVEVSGTTLQCFQIFNIHDLLKYCALLVTKISFTYGLNTEVEDSGISMMVGHVGTITPDFTPADATDKSLLWNSSNEAVATVSQNGVVTAKSTGTCIIKATARDGSAVTQTVEVTVLPLSSSGAGDYTPQNYSGGFN